MQAKKGSGMPRQCSEKGSGMPRKGCEERQRDAKERLRRKAVGCQGKAVGYQGRGSEKGSGMPRKGCEERQWGAKERQWATKGEAVEKGSGMPRKGSVAPPRRGRPLPRSGRPGRKGLSPSGHRIREAQSSSQVAEAIYQKLTVAACDAV